jgi:PAS domain S-box-containing protein
LVRGENSLKTPEGLAHGGTWTLALAPKSVGSIVGMPTVGPGEMSQGDELTVNSTPIAPLAGPPLPPNVAALGVGLAWTIVELAPDGILVCDDGGRILMANRHVESLFGYDREALVGGQVERLLPEPLRHAHELHRAGYVAAPGSRSMGSGRELWGRRSDGSEFPVEISLSPVVADQLIATIVVIRDVSDQRAAEHDARTALGEEEARIGTELNDRVVNHLFSCGLTLASVLTTDLDAAVDERLRDVVETLDTAIRQIRNTVFNGTVQGCD